MRIAITGASGFLGKLIYPKLIDAGYEITVIGRNKEILKSIYSKSEVFDYSELKEAFSKVGLVLHLATVNSDSQFDETQFTETNVNLLKKVACTAKRAGLKRFINISSFHALDSENTSHYATSKRAGQVSLKNLEWDAVETVFLPIVYGETMSGKLSILNLFPMNLRQILLSTISSVKPAVNVDALIEHIKNPTARETEDNSYVLFDDKSKNSTYIFIKRFADLCFAIFIILFFFWLLGLVWLAIRMSSKGPGIFVQTRVGQNQQLFNCYKFRTMKLGTKNTGTHDVAASSITSIGGFLRRTKIDELPQVYNILRNELSLIGPRPCLENQLELIHAREAQGVFDIKPGITGYAQIHDVDMSDPKKLANYDAHYVACRGLLMDFKIMLKTALGKGQGDKTRL